MIMTEEKFIENIQACIYEANKLDPYIGSEIDKDRKVTIRALYLIEIAKDWNNQLIKFNGRDYIHEFLSGHDKAQKIIKRNFVDIMYGK